MNIPAKVTISVGERTFEVYLNDARSLGVLSNGASKELQEMHLLNKKPEDPIVEPLEKDMVELLNATWDAWNVGINMKICRNCTNHRNSFSSSLTTEPQEAPCIFDPVWMRHRRPDEKCTRPKEFDYRKPVTKTE
jgi:hypothetical protein